VTVITSFPHYGQRALGKDYGRGVTSQRLEAGVRVVRVLGFPYAADTVLGRALDYGLYSAISSAAGLMARQPDVVLAVAPPITVGLSGRLVGLSRRAPLVFNAQDIWPDGLIRMGKLRSRPLIRALHGLERLTYASARRIVVLSEGMKDNLLKKMVPPDKIDVVPNWVDLDVIRPVEKQNSFRRELGLAGSFVVLFAGNLGFAAGLDSVLQAAYLLRQARDVAFLIVGEAPGSRGASQELGLENMTFVTSQPADRLSEVFGAADVSLVPLRSGMGSLSVPSKTLAIMASARPVLAAVPPDSEVRRVVDEARCGRCVDPEDPAALAAVIEELRGDGERLEWFGQNGRKFALAHYGRREIVTRYRRLLREVALGASGG
jgi:colanic acid biosynthesis glycosyl transferase WcaI